ncbi:hypothetical protein GF373_01470 [bacterium]|nr:hypothetical protein [bacterium]
MRGRLWNEPFPSNLHLISAVECGDISPCGKSGRWVCGSSSYGSFPVADLRSGDGETCLQAFSVIAYPGDFDASGPYDNDAKGSPDGTKIVFVSNYDLKDGPLAEITSDAESDSSSLEVDSTDGFPDQGRLLLVDGFRREVLSYESKTPYRFEGLKRGLYRTPVATPRNGKILTSFDARVTSAEEWEERNLAQPAPYMLESVEDLNSPLARQHQTDVYLVVIRKPDTPYLWENTRIELIPGENHWETFGYHIYKDGEKITESPLRPGARFSLPGPGNYAAIAVEYSGLESEQSLPLEIEEKSQLYVRKDKPADFSWTQDNWLVDGEQVSIETAMNTVEAVKEIVHRHDGVIHREWYNWGQKTKRHDLNHEGKAIRRLFYRGDRLAKREYFDRQGRQRSLEYFGEDGYMTEKILFGYNDNGERVEETHWWYEEGMPVKLIGRGGYAVGPPGHYVKEGDDFVRID